MAAESRNLSCAIQRRRVSPLESSSNALRARISMLFPSGLINFSRSILARIRERVSGIVRGGLLIGSWKHPAPPAGSPSFSRSKAEDRRPICRELLLRTGLPQGWQIFGGAGIRPPSCSGPRRGLLADQLDERRPGGKRKPGSPARVSALAGNSFAGEDRCLPEGLPGLEDVEDLLLALRGEFEDLHPAGNQHSIGRFPASPSEKTDLALV